MAEWSSWSFHFNRVVRCSRSLKLVNNWVNTEFLFQTKYSFIHSANSKFSLYHVSQSGHSQILSVITLYRSHPTAGHFSFSPDPELEIPMVSTMVPLPHAWRTPFHSCKGAQHNPDPLVPADWTNLVQSDSLSQRFGFGTQSLNHIALGAKSVGSCHVIEREKLKLCWILVYPKQDGIGM